MFNDYLVGIILLSLMKGIENLMFLLICKRFGVEGSLLNRFLKVLVFIGMEMEICFMIFVLGGFFMFSFFVISIDKVCSRFGDFC